MKIDELKKELKDVRAPNMDMIFSPGKTDSAAEFFQLLRQQDRRDEKFLLNKRIIPVLAGLILFTIAVIMAPFRTPVLFTGAILLFLSLLTILIMYFIDYRDISRESFNISVARFLMEKRKRLSYWRSTPFKHNAVFVFFIMGWLLINLGNRRFIRSVGDFPFYLFIGFVLFLMILFHLINERRYRKRHKKEHAPLLKMITDLQQDLDDDNEENWGGGE